METLSRVKNYLAPGVFYFALAIFCIVLIFVREPLGLPGVDFFAGIAQGFFERYGLITLYVSALIESLFMVSFYFPGSLVVVLAILVSDRSITALTIIVLIVWASVLTATAINYWLGKEGFYRLFLKLGSADMLYSMQTWLKKRGRWAVFLSGAHPNILAITNICMGIARVGFLKTMFFSFIAIAFWIPVHVYLLGFVLPDPKESTSLLQWIIVAVLVFAGVTAVRKKHTNDAIHIPEPAV